jgi:hypothetical protein
MQHAILDPDRDISRHGVDVTEQHHGPVAVPDRADGAAGGVRSGGEPAFPHLLAEIRDRIRFAAAQTLDRYQTVKEIDIRLIGGVKL